MAPVPCGLFGRDRKLWKNERNLFSWEILGDCAPCLIGVQRNTGKSILKNLLKAHKDYRYLIQEAGVARPGDMAKSISLLRPNIGIVTTIGQDHYTNFRTLEATAAEKGLLIAFLPKTGKAVLNIDDPHVLGMRQRTQAKVLTYGLSEQADVRATEIRSVWPERLSLTVTYQGESVRIETGLFGDLLSTSLLAAVAGAIAAGVSLQQCQKSLNGIEPFLGRLSIHQGPKNSWIINDTVKAPYWSVDKVLALMGNANASRKTVVMGSFSDVVGADSREYRMMARLALEVADRVFFVGDKATYIKKMITPEVESRLFAFESIESVCRLLAEDCLMDELILLKSNSNYHLERVLCWQQEGFNCWKGVCSKKINCENCDESGLFAVSR